MKSLPSNNPLEHPLVVPVFLVAVVLSIYYPTLYCGINSIDDTSIVAFYTNPHSWSDIFLPGRSYYYRPLIEATFYLDNLLWGMEPRVMHLENIFLHMANVFMVFLLARKITRQIPAGSPLWPLFAALLFAVHPLNVEAVAWIAGRTDPLAAFFILAACYRWICWLELPRWRDVLAVLILFGAGLLTKETTLAFLPVALLLAWGWPTANTPEIRQQRRKAVAVIALLGLLLLALVLTLPALTMAMDRFLALANGTGGHLVGDAFTAFGFYVKKLLVPVPLSFAINEVSPAYKGLGIIAVLGICGGLVRRSLPAIFVAGAAILVVPAIGVALWQVAWTPYAERYLYLPTAFLSLGTCGMLAALPRNYLKLGVAGSGLVVIVGATISLQRSLLWQDTLAFYQDTVAKSPGFGAVYNELGVAWMQQHDAEKAEAAFVAADRLNKRPSLRLVIKANLLRVLIAKGEYAAARELFFKLFAHKAEAPVEFLELLQKADGKRFEFLDGEDKATLARDLIESFTILYAKQSEPFWLYRSGQMALFLGTRDEAREYFHRAYTAAPLDAHYRTAAWKNLQRLDGAK